MHGSDDEAMGAHALVTKGQQLGDHLEGQPLILEYEDEKNLLILGDEAG